MGLGPSGLRPGLEFGPRWLDILWFPQGTYVLLAQRLGRKYTQEHGWGGLGWNGA